MKKTRSFLLTLSINLANNLELSTKRRSHLIDHFSAALLTLLSNTIFTTAAGVLARRLTEIENQQAISSQFWWLRLIINKYAWNEIWQTWMLTRSNYLRKELLRRNKPASSNATTESFVFSRLFLGCISSLENPSAEITRFLINAIEDQEGVIQERSRALLSTAKKQESTDQICIQWFYHRNQYLASLIKQKNLLPKKNYFAIVYCLLLKNQVDDIALQRPEAVQPLISAISCKELQISQAAEFVLRNLRDQGAINKFCEVYAGQRTKQLETILVESRFIASEPITLKFLCLIKLQRFSVLEKTLEVEPLVKLLNDADQQVRKISAQILMNLSSPVACEQLLDIFIETSEKNLIPIVNEGNFYQCPAHKFALALFLAENWKRYEELDFNFELLRQSFNSDNQIIKTKIMRLIQKSGKPQYLQIMLDVKTGALNNHLSKPELDTSLQIMAHHKNWSKYWELIRQAYVDQLLAGLDILETEGWQPKPVQERRLLERILDHKQNVSNSEPDIVWKSVPFAVPISILKFKGRINDVSFAHNQPNIALATNQRAVMIWNYKTGKSETLLKGFNHSIGQLIYNENDNLFVSEKTTSSEYCDIWSWADQKLALIGFHNGTVAAIHPAGKNLIVTCGKDKRLTTWDIHTRQAISEKYISDWPRASIITNSGRLLIGHQGLFQYSIPDFDSNYLILHNKNRNIRNGMPTCISVSKHLATIILGRHNGQVVAYYNQPGTFKYEGTLLHQSAEKIIGLKILDKVGYTIIADRSGNIFIADKETLDVIPLKHKFQKQFTSIHIAPNQQLFATGTNDSDTILWDLRPLRLKNLLFQKLQDFSPHDLSTLKFIREKAAIDGNIKNLLSIMIAVLEYRFQYDIDIVETDQILPGAFDIEIA